MQIRPTQAVVDLGAIAANVQLARRYAPRAQLCAVVKANAYGHGIVPVARTAAACGVDWLGVALVEEGMQLRDAGITAPILVWGAALEGGYDAVVQTNLTPVVSHAGHIEGLARAAGNRLLGVHVEVDTGMARLGVTMDGLDALLTHLQKYPNLHLAGLMSHMAVADVSSSFNDVQLQRWEQAQRIVQGHGLQPAVLHVANSPAALSLPQSHQSLVRCGLLLYGLDPMSFGGTTQLQPALRWTTQVVAERLLPPNTPISYGCRFTTTRTSRIGTIAVGYADGYFRCLGNRGAVLIRGQRAPVVGTVCMDLCMVDLTHIPEARVGDEVVLIGQSGAASLSADHVAAWCDTISYEILCAIGARVPRHYINTPVAT